jgi:hypothetical protein
MEARLIIMSQATDHDMGNREEEAARHLTKKTTSTSFTSSSAGYLSPTRVSNESKKRNQVSSPATHYAIRNHGPPTPGDNNETTLQFFAPGGDAEKTIADATALSWQLASHKKTPSKVIKVNDNKENDDDDDIDGNPGDFMGDESDASPELRQDATSQSPMACQQLQISIASPQSVCLLSGLPALLRSSATPPQAWMELLRWTPIF